MKFFGVLKIRAPPPCFRVATPNIGVAGGGGWGGVECARAKWGVALFRRA